MKNKSIISAITFLLISVFYITSASASVNVLSFNVPERCGVAKEMPNTFGCSQSTGKNKGTAKDNDLRFTCVGGGNGRGVVSITSENCGRVTVTQFFNPKNSGNSDRPLRGKMYSEVTTNNAFCNECYDRKIQGFKALEVLFNINVCPPGSWTSWKRGVKKVCVDTKNGHDVKNRAWKFNFYKTVR
jgi:hypothetical protein